MIRCPNCGTENPDASMVCGICGTHFDSAVPADPGNPLQPYEENTNQKNQKALIAGIIVAVILLAALIAGIIFFAGHRDKEPTTAAPTFATGTTVTAESTTAPDTTATAESTTEKPATTAAPKAAVDAEIGSDNYNDMELLLSNFAETEMMEYSDADGDLETVINFSLLHRFINNSGGLEISSDITLPYDAVKRDAERFFNLSLSESDMRNTALARYDSGQHRYIYDDDFLENAASHTRIENTSCFVVAVPTEITLNGDGSYSVAFDIYQSYNPISDSDYRSRPDDTALQSDFARIGSGSATLESRSGNQYSNYLVTEYYANY